MSVYNKRKDRNKLGRINRKFTANNGARFGTPKWWKKEFFVQRKRVGNKRVCKLIMAGRNSDSLIYEVHNRKPHKYYW